MKKFTIFLILLFFASAILFHPDRVSVGSGIAERFIQRLSVFEENGDAVTHHLDIIQEVKIELEYLKTSYHSIPDTFDNAGTLQGIFLLLKTLTITVLDVLAVPIVLTYAFIVFLIDSIILIFNLLSLLDLFTIKI